MNNKFVLIETTGIGIIEDDKSNNQLFKTEGNEEEVREVLEIENEIENEENKMKDINEQIKKNHINIFAKYISYISSAALILALIPTCSIIVNQGYTLSNTLTVVALFGSLGALSIIKKRIPYKKLIKDNELLYHDLDLSEDKKEELQKELKELKTDIKMENIELEEINSLVSPSIIYPQDNTENMSELTNTGKVKSLRKEF